MTVSPMAALANQVAVREQHRHLLRPALHRHRVLCQDVRPVEVKRDAPEALRLALRDQHRAGCVEPGALDVGQWDYRV